MHRIVMVGVHDSNLCGQTQPVLSLFGLQPLYICQMNGVNSKSGITVMAIAHHEY